MKMKQISILKGILLVSLVAVIVYPIYVFTFLYPSFHKLIIEDKENDAQQIVNYLVQDADITTAVLNKWAEYLTLDQLEEVEDFRKIFDLIKVRIFSSMGTIVYSTDKSEIDKDNKNMYFENIVKKGSVYSKYIKKGKESAEGQDMSIDVVEVYVPIMNNGEFSGAVEVYYDITPVLNESKIFFRNSNIIISIIVLVLLLVITFTFLKANANIKARNRIELKLTKQNDDLEKALNEIKTLQGIVPICSYCKKVRDDEGFWQQVDDYINKHSEASVSHGVCPDCIKIHFPDMKELHRRLGIN